MTTGKTCVRCREVKPCSEYYRCQRWKDGLDYWCKPCRKAATAATKAKVKSDPIRRAVWTAQNIAASKKRKAKIAANPEEFADEIERTKEKARAYYREHKEVFVLRVSARKARLHGGGGSHSSEAWRQLKDLFGNRCLCCGVDGRLTKDHVVPVTAGGSDNIENIQPLCLRCNKAKFTGDVDYRTRDKVTLTELNDVGRLIFEGGPVKVVALRKRVPSSKFTGVAWSEQNWRAYIRIGGKLKHLGRFKNEQDAALAYNVASVESFGPTAFVNAV